MFNLIQHMAVWAPGDLCWPGSGSATRRLASDRFRGSTKDWRPPGAWQLPTCWGSTLDWEPWSSPKRPKSMHWDTWFWPRSRRTGPCMFEASVSTRTVWGINAWGLSTSGCSSGLVLQNPLRNHIGRESAQRLRKALASSEELIYGKLKVLDSVYHFLLCQKVMIQSFVNKPRFQAAEMNVSSKFPLQYQSHSSAQLKEPNVSGAVPRPGLPLVTDFAVDHFFKPGLRFWVVWLFFQQALPRWCLQTRNSGHQ